MTGKLRGDRAAPLGARRPRRRDELITLGLPELGKRPSRSPAAWLHAMLEGPLASNLNPHVDALADLYASRAVRRDGRWVVVIGEHEPRRHVRRLRAVDLAKLACAPGRALLDFADAAAFLDADVPAVRLQPLADPAPDCSAGAAGHAVDALGYLASLGHAALRVHDETCVTGVITVPNTRA